MYRRIDKCIYSIYMLVEIVKVGNLHSKLRCGTKESFQSWRQTKTTSEALQREQCHRGAHGLGRWRVLQDWTTIWFNLIQLYWSITWDTWWLVVEWVLNKPTSKGQRHEVQASSLCHSSSGDRARRLRRRIWWRHACVTWHNRLSSKDRIRKSKIWKYVDWFPDRSIDPSPSRNLGPSKRFVLSCGVRKLNGTFLSSLLSECQILFSLS